jgi:hypothetical protein
MENTTLIVVGYSLQLAGFAIAILELVVTRVELSAALRRLGVVGRRLLGVTVEIERELTEFQGRQASQRHKVIRAPAGPEVESRVRRLERQIQDLEGLIDRDRATLEERFREQQAELEQLRTHLTNNLDELERGRHRDLTRRALWSLLPLLLFVGGTALNIAGTVGSSSQNRSFPSFSGSARRSISTTRPPEIVKGHRGGHAVGQDDHCHEPAVDQRRTAMRSHGSSAGQDQPGHRVRASHLRRNQRAQCPALAAKDNFRVQ